MAFEEQRERVARSLTYLLAAALLFLAQRAEAQAGGCGALDPDCFVERGGASLSAARAYNALHRPPEAHHLIALGEDVAFLAIGTTWYWLAREKNLVDWDRPSAKARFTLDVIRLDNNDFPINFTLHPWSGAAYYAAARTSGVSLGLSSLYAIGATLAWEYGIEFKEKVSLNDLIFTPLPGITLGEFFSRLMFYVNRFPTRPSLKQRVLGRVFGPLVAFSDALSGQNQVVSGPRDNLGLSASTFHRFFVHVGAAFDSAGGAERALATFGIDGSFVAVPSHLRPGRLRKLLRDADFLRLTLAQTQGAGEHEFDSYADMSLFGIYEQKISADLRGGYVFLGSSLGYRYRRSQLRGFRDEVAATHLPGLMLETSLLFGPGLSFHLSYRMQPDFAGVRALAYPAWQAAHPEAHGKTTVEKHGYLYSFGLTSLLEASLAFPRLVLGGRTWFASYDSVEGLDRTQETLTADPRGFDRVLDAEAFLRLSPFATHGITIELRVLSRRRSSQLGGYRAEASLLRAGLQVGVLF